MPFFVGDHVIYNGPAHHYAQPGEVGVVCEVDSSPPAWSIYGNIRVLINGGIVPTREPDLRLYLPHPHGPYKEDEHVIEQDDMSIWDMI